MSYCIKKIYKKMISTRKILEHTFSAIWVVSVVFCSSVAHATLVQVTQISSPVGHVNQSEAVAPGTAYQSIQPSLTSTKLMQILNLFFLKATTSMS